MDDVVVVLEHHALSAEGRWIRCKRLSPVLPDDADRWPGRRRRSRRVAVAVVAATTPTHRRDGKAAHGRSQKIHMIPLRCAAREISEGARQIPAKNRGV